MAAYSSTLYTAQAAGTVPVQAHGLAGDVKCLYASVAVDTSLALNDTLNFGYVPKNARLVGALLKSTDIDTNGSPVVTFDVGDAGSATRIFSASAVGQAGTADNNCLAAGYQFADKTAIIGTVHAAAATKAAGTVYLTLYYTIEGSAS